MSLIDQAIQHARASRERCLKKYRELVAIPSVSTLPEHKQDVLRAADWLAVELKRLGMRRVDLFSTPGHPIVYAASEAQENRPSILVYGHYDVQPVDPINEWCTGPFDGNIEGDYIYGRGASDMKGQIFALLQAVEALIEQGPLPVNLKFLIEGEEEIGSPSLEGFIESHKDLLACDVVLNCDGGIHAPDVPSITYSLRGLAYFELEIRTHEKDLHSGLFGGSIRNPIHVLCELIAGMHDASGRVTLPGFYDEVRDLNDEERALLQRVPYDDEDWLRMAGARGLFGENGYSTVERIGARPTLEVNGIWGGFIGAGAKTVLPAHATAKISTRLVADQKHGNIRGYLESYLERSAPKEVAWELRELSHGPGGIMDRKSPYIRAAAVALKEVFGVEPIFKREGGSVPVVGMMQEQLGVDSVMLGFALPDDGIHGPNERQYLPNFFRGIETYIRFFSESGSL